MLTIGLALALGAGAEPITLPTFSFRTLKAGVPADPKFVAHCKAQANGARVCRRIDTKIAERYAQATIIFYNNRLSALGVYPLRRYYGDVKAALESRYGAACKNGFETWKNAVGTALDNPVTTWCFASGTLELRQFGDYLDESSVVYTDIVQPPRSAGKVDF